jgi:thioesterase domain-containing protein
MDGSFLDLLATEKEVVLGAQAHQDLPFYILREMAQDPKDQRAIIQALFLMQNMEIPPLHLPGVRAETLNVDMGKAIVDLTLEMYETEAGMHGWFEYATRIFSAATIARLARYYVLLIEAVVENPRLPLKALPDFSAVSAPDPGSLPPIWIVPTPPEKVRTSTLSELPGGRMLPEDPVERRVAEIWARVIGSREIYRHDNFFKIGGHSLFAVVMLGHVERIFGKRIAPLRLYQAPTLSEFAALLREGGIKPPRTSVHAIRETGGRTPMYFVGSTDLLPPMADALGPDQPLYSLNIFGLQEPDGGYTFTSVPDIAARFIQDMRAVQPSGPYVLGGYCRDTMVAYEMARQLQADGEEIAHVALVDTYWDTWDAYGRWHRHFRNLRMLGPGYVVEKWRRKVKAWRELYNRIHSRRVARRTTSQGALAHSHRDTLFINAYYDIVASSEPGEYRGDVHLYAASEWGLRDVPNWRRIVHGKVSLEEVQACHYNLWDPPQVDRLGSAIRAQLETGRHPRQ